MIIYFLKEGIEIMSHKTEWFLENRIVLITYNGDLDKEELSRLNGELETFLEQGKRPLHLISDNRNMGKAELNLEMIRDAFSVMKKDGWGWVIVIGLNPLIRFFAEIFATQFKLHVKSAHTVEEAYEMLKKLDISLAETV